MLISCSFSVYYLLDKSLSLDSNLHDKLIIEHPVLWVTCSSEREKEYPTLETQNREEAEEQAVEETRGMDCDIPVNPECLIDEKGVDKGLIYGMCHYSFKILLCM